MTKIAIYKKFGKQLYIIFIYPHADCLKSTKLNAANSQCALKQHMYTILQLYTLLYFK